MPTLVVDNEIPHTTVMLVFAYVK